LHDSTHGVRPTTGCTAGEIVICPLTDAYSAWSSHSPHCGTLKGGARSQLTRYSPLPHHLDGVHVSHATDPLAALILVFLFQCQTRKKCTNNGEKNTPSGQAPPLARFRFPHRGHFRCKHHFAPDARWQDPGACDARRRGRRRRIRSVAARGARRPPVHIGEKTRAARDAYLHCFMVSGVCECVLYLDNSIPLI
jgi:hypothetical protein